MNEKHFDVKYFGNLGWTVWNNKMNKSFCVFDKKYQACKVCEKMNEIHEKHDEVIAILGDIADILNKLQANPTDKQLLGVARDLLQNMNIELKT